MDLKEQLARQSLLLQFISECGSVGSIAALVAILNSHLKWVAEFDVCTACLPGEDGKEHWCSISGAEMCRSADSGLPSVHCEALAAAMSVRAPQLLQSADPGVYGLALPLTSNGEAHGAVCVGRSGAPFSQGEVRHLQHACTALSAALTRIVGAIAERQAQREVDLAEARLRALAEDRALLAEQMIGIVSHDLRNPLSTIMVGTSLLGRGETLTPQKARVLDSVGGAVRRARRMVDDLLDFTLTRVGDGLKVTRTAVDLHDLVAHSIDELTLAFEGKDIRQVELGSGAVSADADRITQAVGNLIANAVTYGDSGSPIVVTSSIDAQLASIAVQNGGPPIPPSLQSSIFEPMVRGARQSSSRSVGLGLFIVRAIAQAHGGGVHVASSERDGTTFRITFPIS